MAFPGFGNASGTPSSGFSFGTTPAKAPAGSSSLFGNVGGSGGTAPAATTSSFGNLGGFGTGLGNATTSAPSNPLGGATAGGTTLGGGIFGGTGLGGTAFGTSLGTAGVAPLLGAHQQQQQQANPTVTSNLFAAGAGHSLLGALGNVAPGQPLIPGVRIDLSNIRPTTRFSDLNPEIQQKIIKVHEYITSQISLATSCAAVMQTAESGNGASRLPIDLDLLPKDVEMVTNKLENVTNSISRDIHTIVNLKNMLKSAEADLASVSHAIESVKLPAAMKMSGLWSHYFGASRHGGSRPDLGATTSRPTGQSADSTDDRKTGSSADIVSLFQTRTDQLETELESIKKLIGLIEQHLSIVENRASIEVERLARSQHGTFNMPAGGLADVLAGADATGQNPFGITSSPQMQEMMDTIRLFETAILKVAGRICELREKLVDLTTRTVPAL